MTNEALNSARRIINNWDEWQAEADYQSQIEQDERAGELIMEGHLYREMSNLVEKCALVCEGRASVCQNQIGIYNEGMKCAAQIRFNMLTNQPRGSDE